MREKLLNLMKSEGLTSSRLAEILEIQPSGVSHILSGRNKPGFDLLQKILRRFPRINPDWLLLDSDRMYRDDTDSPASTLTTAADNSPDDLFASHSHQPTSPKVESRSATNTPASGDPETRDESRIPWSEVKNQHVVRVVLFYADQTFESFAVKR